MAFKLDLQATTTPRPIYRDVPPGMIIYRPELESQIKPYVSEYTIRKHAWRLRGALVEIKRASRRDYSTVRDALSRRSKGHLEALVRQLAPLPQETQIEVLRLLPDLTR